MSAESAREHQIGAPARTRELEVFERVPDGSLAKGERQRRLLGAEGVPFRGERVDMRVARIPEPGA